MKEKNDETTIDWVSELWVQENWFDTDFRFNFIPQACRITDKPVVRAVHDMLISSQKVEEEERHKILVQSSLWPVHEL